MKGLTWKQSRDLLAYEKGLQPMKVKTIPSLNIWLDLQLFVPRSCSQPKFKHSVSYKAGSSIVSSFTIHLIDSLKKKNNKKAFDKADSSVDKNLSCPRITLSNSQTKMVDEVEFRVSMSDFARQLRCKNADVPDIHFTSIDDAGTSPTLVPNQNAATKERRRFLPFKYWPSDAANLVQTGWFCLCVCAKLVES